MTSCSLRRAAFVLTRCYTAYNFSITRQYVGYRRNNMNYTKDVEKAKATYLSGMRVRLLKIDDAQAPAVGTEEL